MRCTTRGVVLHYMKYRETSIIVRIFTEAFGKQSFLVPGVRAAKAKHPIALFQPLVPLDMVIYHRKHTSLQRVVEVKCHAPVINILSDMKKAAIASFLTELLHKVLYEEDQNVRLFAFILQSINRLEQLTAGYELFYLDFMLQVCEHLGFRCIDAAEINKQLVRAGFSNPFDTHELNLLDKLLNHTPQEIVVPSKQSLRNVLDNLIKFMQLHIDTLDTLKSVIVLQEIGGEV